MSRASPARSQNAGSIGPCHYCQAINRVCNCAIHAVQSNFRPAGVLFRSRRRGGGRKWHLSISGRLRIFWNAFGAVILTVLHVGLAFLTTIHVLLYKRDVPAAIGWMGLAWFSPIIGPALYWMFGINRVRRRAYRISRRYAARRPPPPPIGALRSEKYAALERAVGVITHRSTLAGNTITSLRNGDEAYPAMLQAIIVSTRRPPCAISASTGRRSSASTRPISSSTSWTTGGGGASARCTEASCTGGAVGPVRLGPAWTWPAPSSWNSATGPVPPGCCSRPGCSSAAPGTSLGCMRLSQPLTPPSLNSAHPVRRRRRACWRPVRALEASYVRRTRRARR